MEKSFPDLKTRVQSTFIDAILMLLLMFGAGIVLERMNPEQESEDGMTRAIIFGVIWGVYEPLSMTLGSTLGNYLMKIRSRQYSDNSKKLNIFQSYLRFIVKILLGWLSFLTIHFNPERRAIHDLVAGSVMLEKN